MTRQERIAAGHFALADWLKTPKGQKLSKYVGRYLHTIQGLTIDEYMKARRVLYKRAWIDLKNNSENARRSWESRRSEIAFQKRHNRIMQGRMAFNKWFDGPGCIYKLMAPEHGSRRERLLAVRQQLIARGWTNLETAELEFWKYVKGAALKDLQP